MADNNEEALTLTRQGDDGVREVHYQYLEQQHSEFGTNIYVFTCGPISNHVLQTQKMYDLAEACCSELVDTEVIDRDRKCLDKYQKKAVKDKLLPRLKECTLWDPVQDPAHRKLNRKGNPIPLLKLSNVESHDYYFKNMWFRELPLDRGHGITLNQKLNEKINQLVLTAYARLRNRRNQDGAVRGEPGGIIRGVPNDGPMQIDEPDDVTLASDMNSTNTAYFFGSDSGGGGSIGEHYNERVGAVVTGNTPPRDSSRVNNNNNNNHGGGELGDDKRTPHRSEETSRTRNNWTSVQDTDNNHGGGEPGDDPNQMDETDDSSVSPVGEDDYSRSEIDLYNERVEMGVVLDALIVAETFQSDASSVSHSEYESDSSRNMPPRHSSRVNSNSNNHGGGESGDDPNQMDETDDSSFEVDYLAEMGAVLDPHALLVAECFEALENGRSGYGEDHAVTADLYYKLGIAYLKNDGFDNSIANFQGAVAITLRTTGTEFANAATAVKFYCGIGDAYCKRSFLDSDYANALGSYWLAILMCNLDSEPYQEKAHAYCGIGIANFKWGKFDLAISHFEAALALGLLHDDAVAKTYDELGQAYHASGDRIKAIHSYQKAINIHGSLHREAKIRMTEDHEVAYVIINSNVALVVCRVYMHMADVYQAISDSISGDPQSKQINLRKFQFYLDVASSCIYGL
jgi:tetratricopeptide (TPR) repeat protein